MKYELINHTADISIKFFGDTIQKLFTNSAISLSEIIFNQKQKGNKKNHTKMQLNFSANEITVLYIDFLREILFQINQNYRYFYKFKITKFSEQKLSIDCYFQTLNCNNITSEIKAVTYHNIEIKKAKNIYYATVIFDI